MPELRRSMVVSFPAKVATLSDAAEASLITVRLDRRWWMRSPRVSPSVQPGSRGLRDSNRLFRSGGGFVSGVRRSDRFDEKEMHLFGGDGAVFHALGDDVEVSGA